MRATLPLAIVVSTALVAVLPACGGGGGGSKPVGNVARGGAAPAPAAIDASGTWDGDFAEGSGPATAITIDIQQAGASFTGTYAAANGAAGSISGDVSGSVIGFTMTSTVAACAGAYAGSGIVMGDTMAFRLSGADCGGAYADIHGTASRAAAAPATPAPGGLAGGAGAAAGVLRTLPYRVIDAEYSAALDRVVLVSAAPAAELHVHDPVAGTTRTLALASAPSCLSLSADGRYAAVGHDKKISYVALAGPTVLKSLTVSADVGEILLAGGSALVVPRPAASSYSYYSSAMQVSCVDLTTGGEVFSPQTLAAGARLRLHPSGNVVYASTGSAGSYYEPLEKLEMVSGLAVPLWSAPYSYSGYSTSYGYGANLNVWISEDGLRLFLPTGQVLRSSTLQTEDMTAAGALPTLGRHIRELAQSRASGKIAAIPNVAQTSSYSTAAATTEDTQVEIYDAANLGFERAHRLPAFDAGGRLFPAHGRFAFFDRAGTRLFVVVQADATSGLLNEWGIVAF